MASWKLCVEDYGKIKSAEMECAPLTLVVGDNNCGKSHSMSLLWGIKNIGAIHLFEKRDAEGAVTRDGSRSLTLAIRKR